MLARGMWETGEMQAHFPPWRPSWIQGHCQHTGHLQAQVRQASTPEGSFSDGNSKHCFYIKTINT